MLASSASASASQTPASGGVATRSPHRLRESTLAAPVEVADELGGGSSVLAAAPAARGAKPVPEHVYVVVHCVDGAPLRSEASQALLAALSAIPQVHLVASCDHRNTATLWDAKKARQLNWAWAEAPTGETYAHESADGIHELLGRLTEAAAGTEGRSAEVVLSALTVKAQKVFAMLVRHQLDNPRLAGMPFEELYKAARTAFVCSSEKALKQHINEYVDHALVRKRNGAGGKLCYFVDLPRDTMQSILDNMEPQA